MSLAVSVLACLVPKTTGDAPGAGGLYGRHRELGTGSLEPKRSRWR